MPAEPTAAQTTALMITERTTSVMSLLGTAFILSTFAYWPAFHKPINRLVVFASLGNIIGNAATLISTSGVTAGIDSPTCQFQAFVIQWCDVLCGTSLSVTYVVQVSPRGCALDVVNGLQCLSHLFQKVQCGTTKGA